MGGLPSQGERQEMCLEDRGQVNVEGSAGHGEGAGLEPTMFSAGDSCLRVLLQPLEKAGDNGATSSIHLLPLITLTESSQR